MKTEHGGDLPLKNLRTASGLTQSDLEKDLGIKPAYVSLYENEKPVPQYAKMAIDSGVGKQEPA